MAISSQYIAKTGKTVYYDDSSGKKEEVSKPSSSETKSTSYHISDTPRYKAQKEAEAIRAFIAEGKTDITKDDVQKRAGTYKRSSSSNIQASVEPSNGVQQYSTPAGDISVGKESIGGKDYQVTASSPGVVDYLSGRADPRSQGYGVYDTSKGYSRQATAIEEAAIKKSLEENKQSIAEGSVEPVYATKEYLKDNPNSRIYFEVDKEGKTQVVYKTKSLNIKEDSSSDNGNRNIDRKIDGDRSSISDNIPDREMDYKKSDNFFQKKSKELGSFFEKRISSIKESRIYIGSLKGEPLLSSRRVEASKSSISLTATSILKGGSDVFLHPIKTAKGIYQTFRHPIKSGKQLVSGIISNPEETVGEFVGTNIALGPVGRVTGKGVSKVATKGKSVAVNLYAEAYARKVESIAKNKKGLIFAEDIPPPKLFSKELSLEVRGRPIESVEVLGNRAVSSRGSVATEKLSVRLGEPAPYNPNVPKSDLLIIEGVGGKRTTVGGRSKTSVPGREKVLSRETELGPVTSKQSVVEGVGGKVITKKEFKSLFSENKIEVGFSESGVSRGVRKVSDKGVDIVKQKVSFAEKSKVPVFEEKYFVGGVRELPPGVSPGSGPLAKRPSGFDAYKFDDTIKVETSYSVPKNLAGKEVKDVMISESYAGKELFVFDRADIVRSKFGTDKNPVQSVYFGVLASEPSAKINEFKSPDIKKDDGSSVSVGSSTEVSNADGTVSVVKFKSDVKSEVSSLSLQNKSIFSKLQNTKQKSKQQKKEKTKSESRTDQEFASKEAYVENLKTSQKSGTKSRTKQKQRLKPSLAFKSVQTQGQLPVQSQVPSQIQKPAQAQKQSQKQSQAQIPELLSRQVSKQASLNVDSSVSLLNTSSSSVRSVRPIFPSNIGSRKTREAFDVQVRTGGEFKTIVRGLPQGRALKAGSDIAVKSLAASFRIVKSGVTKASDINFAPSEKVFRSYRIKEGSRIPLENTFIQKTTQEGGAKGGRLASGFEVSEIQSKKKKKSKR